jgi:hypothetical protein
MTTPILAHCPICGTDYDLAAWLALPLDGHMGPAERRLEIRTCPRPCRNTHGVRVEVLLAARERRAA